MLRNSFLLVVALMQLFWLSPALAMEVADLAITTAVIDREPVDNVEVFPSQNGTLYCFSRIVGAAEPTAVQHAWYREGTLMSRVTLAVNSSDWRTWSLEHFPGESAGVWRVEVQDLAGTVLREISFRLR